MAKCAICGQREATKKNSHLIPSFIISMVSSYDGSNKRDKEMLFTFKPLLSSFYAGRSVTAPAFCDFYNSLSEDKKEKINNHQSFAPDYIFCPECEKKLGNLLESSYSAKQKNATFNGLVSIMFWLSVIWRISKFDYMACKLPPNYEESMRPLLAEYLECNGNIQDEASFIHKLPFTYKILHCNDFCKQNAGYIVGNYDCNTQCATYFMGDFVLQVYFAQPMIQTDIFTLNPFFDKAKLNTGQELELKQKLTIEQLQTAYHSLVNFYGKMRIANEKDYIQLGWNTLRCKFGFAIPSVPSDDFCQLFLSQIYNENKKPYEVISNEERAKIFVNLFLQLYGLSVLPKEKIISDVG
ncbi:MAG: hypothetical protein K6F33_13995 [Bacteroidales bacterium]|nr:hypothetical protein [Bacteroidales bacterium]